MANSTLELPHLPHLPFYTLTPVQPLLPWISDFHLSLVLPVAAYWLMSLIFWYIDRKDLWSQYRLHTPEEFKQRNRVSQAEVLRSVIFQQAIQTGLGLLIGYMTNPGDSHGSQHYDIALWATRIHQGAHQVRKYTPWILISFGIDVKTLGRTLHGFSISLGPANKFINQMLPFLSGQDSQTGLAAWEISFAKLIYWVLEPACRFGIAIFFSDSWQYFWHRAMHSNKWMYRNIHAHHHKIYVPYAFGAFYNTLTEAFLLDTIGTTLSLMLSGLTIRQTMWFGTISVMKGVDDHCGYRLPWDPLQWGNEQNTQFHDIHHQSWGIKSNYSQLYTTFWDHVCNTICPKTNEEMERLYEKGRTTAERLEEMQTSKVQ